MVSILHDEGKIRFDTSAKAIYQYFITDHLGNTRVIFEKLNDSTYTAQENHYGVWGEVLQGLGTQGDWNFLFQGKEYVDAFGLNSYDFHSRTYDQNLGRMWQVDGANQFASGYVGMGNMPISYIDPDGQWIHIAIGAVVGGVINVATHWNKIKGFKQGLVAFGIGAVAGGLTAATGGAAAGAFGLSAATFAGGAVAGATGAAVGGPIQGIGNMIAFQDSYSLKDFGLGIVSGAALGGATGSVLGKFPKFTDKVGNYLFKVQTNIERALGFGKTPSVQLGNLVQAEVELPEGEITNSFGGRTTGQDLGNGMSTYDQAMQGMSNEFTSFYHKGNLDGGIVRSTGRGLSTSMDKSTVQGLERAGRVWEFRIPKDDFSLWKSQGLVNPLTDTDFKTGIINQEWRFSPKLAPQLNRYIVR